MAEKKSILIMVAMMAAVFAVWVTVVWNATTFSTEAVAIFSLLIGWSLGKSYMKIKKVMKYDD